ncbi:MAG: tRNA (guanosine(37)-N1)-methyltransferase TrmD [Acidobacteria bacterium]|nr:tRNA (guanosine(37)-N1)-methyltransferase TrmD [Acidobacteriota bacterium]
MQFDVVTIFPDFFRSILDCGLMKRAQAGGQLRVSLHDLRDFTEDRHRTVDDRPFGGGPGMVFKPLPVFRAVEAIKSSEPEAVIPVILLSPQGRLLKQSVVEELSRHPRIVLICGRYEGVDERVAEHLATDELSIGDYVLSGGELAAAVVMESVTRLLPGVLGNEESATQDSFGAPGISGEMAQHRLLDCPHYTRPAEFRGMRVPEVLLSGDHEEIRRWRRRRALEKTWRKRPDLLADLELSEEDLRLLENLKQTSLPALSREG